MSTIEEEQKTLEDAIVRRDALQKAVNKARDRLTSLTRADLKNPGNRDLQDRVDEAAMELRRQVAMRESANDEVARLRRLINAHAALIDTVTNGVTAGKGGKEDPEGEKEAPAEADLLEEMDLL